MVHQITIVTVTYCSYNNLWTSKFMALEKPGNLGEFFSPTLWPLCQCHFKYTVSQKKACDYIFCNNWNNECPIIIIFGTLINETICHRMVVSFPTSSI